MPHTREAYGRVVDQASKVIRDRAASTDDSHPTAGFDDTVHQPTRLAIMVILKEARRADFRYLKRTLELADGNLGRLLNSLERAGFHKRRPQLPDQHRGLRAAVVNGPAHR